MYYLAEFIHLHTYTLTYNLPYIPINSRWFTNSVHFSKNVIMPITCLNIVY